MPENSAAIDTARNTGLPPVLKRFGALILVLTLLSELYSATMSYFFHERPPYGGTFSWEDTGVDLRIVRPRFDAFHSPHFWDPGAYVFPYPAPLAIVYWLLYQIPHYLEVYLAIGIAIFAVWAWYFAAKLSACGISRNWAFVVLLAFLAMEWPVRFLLQTSNTEMLLALVLGAGILTAVSGRWALGASLIGLAAAMKIYPFMLFGLVLAQRRYRAFAWGVAVATIANIASLAILGPSILEAQHHIREGLSFLKQTFVLLPVPNGLQFSHSLFNLVKIAVVVFARLDHPGMGAARALYEMRLMQSALSIYMPAVAALGILLYIVRIRKLPLLNQVLALAVCAVVLPPYSLDYTLVELLVPLGLLCVFATEEWARGYEPRGLGLCYTCFALIFTTGAYFELKYRFAAQVRTLALLVLLGAALHYRFEPESETA